MSSIGSSSYYSASMGTSGGGISGLASGMDTEAMVEKMLAGTQNALNKQEGMKQQNIWRQEIYRDIINTINSFQTKFFNTTYGASSTSNLASSAFFDTMLSAVSKGSAAKVLSSSSSASVGDMKLAVEQLASNTVLRSDQKMSTGRVIASNKDISAATIDKTFSNRISFVLSGSVEMDIDVTDATSVEDMADRINQSFSGPGSSLSGKISAKVVEGKLQIESTDSTISVQVNKSKSSVGALKAAGLHSFSITDVKDKDGNVTGSLIQGSTPQANKGYSFDMTLDGVTKTINLKNVPIDPRTGKVTAETLKTALDGEVQRAFGDYVKVDMTGNTTDGFRFAFKLNMTDSGHELNVTGKDVELLGIKAGSSTSVNSLTKLSDLGISGDKFTFTINGREFKFTGDDTIGSVISKVNSSDAGVKLSYSTISDTFKMESSSTGEKFNIQLDQQEGDLLSAMFGSKINSAGSITSKRMTTDSIMGTDLAADYKSDDGAKLTMTVNGITATFEQKTGGDKAAIEAEFNTWLKTTFNPAGQQGTGDAAKISLKDGKLSIADGYQVSFAASKVDISDSTAVEKAMKTDLAFALGFNKTATSNTATMDTSIANIHELQGVNATKADGSPATTLGEIAAIGGQPVTVKDDRLVITGSGNIDLSGIGLEKLFGKDSVDLGDGKTAADAVEQGTDAIIYVNGEKTTRSSNNVSIDGISLELTQVSTKDAAGKLEDTVISTSRDTDSIVKGFESFVEDYNKMVDKLNGYIDEDPTYKKYNPLSIEQKKEMSDREIELWEENSKKGLIRRDSTVQQFLSEMRIGIYTKPAGAKFALYNVGISTTENYKEKGKLQLDETALRNAIAADPEAVKNLFTNATDGIAKTLNAAMNRTAKESSGSPGTLVQLAGTSKAMEKNNTLYDRNVGIANRIKDLKVKYEKERARYWNQFTAMETALSNMNQQSMTLTNQLSGG